MSENWFYCESAWAGPLSRWHIRPAGPLGLRPNGGADTRALCGQEVSWDIDLFPVTGNDPVCGECARVFGRMPVVRVSDRSAQ